MIEIEMFRSTRVIVSLSLVGGGVVAVIVGWVTGFFARAAAFVSNAWAGLTSWVTQPLDLSHLLAGLGVLVVPLIVLAFLLVLSDGR